MRSLALLLLLAGCANMGWSVIPDALPLPGVVVPSTPDEVKRHCPHIEWVWGCSVRDLAHHQCLVYVGPDAPGWLVEHEAMHCMGYSHRGQ